MIIILNTPEITKKVCDMPQFSVSYHTLFYNHMICIKINL
jgi:hypothetical protein